MKRNAIAYERFWRDFSDEYSEIQVLDFKITCQNCSNRPRVWNFNVCSYLENILCFQHFQFRLLKLRIHKKGNLFGKIKRTMEVALTKKSSDCKRMPAHQNFTNNLLLIEFRAAKIDTL